MCKCVCSYIAIMLLHVFSLATVHDRAKVLRSAGVEAPVHVSLASGLFVH